MSKQRILIIDDEPMNIRVLQTDLESEGYTTLSAADGCEGLQVLRESTSKIDAILLDRMMPNMDGMEFLKTVKADPNLDTIPVIMQTASALTEEVSEGIEAGVFYYLTKPYDHRIMLSIVKSACSDYARQSQLRADIRQYKSKIRLIKNSSFEYQTLEEAKYLTTFIANFFPDPERVILGISELLINAIEHGNLGITYDEKTELNKNNEWIQEVEKRQQLAEFKDRAVIVDYVRTADKISLTITDQGDGFDFKNYLELSPSRAEDNHGRGIAMSRMISFDELEYQGKGNVVVAVVFEKST